MARLSPEQAAGMVFDWHLWARDTQLPPPGDWVTWLLMGGRGSGKTRAGAEWVRALAAEGIGPIALVGETITEAIAVMVEGPSGLLAVTPPGERPKLSGATIHWPNGVSGTILGAADPERFRGPQFAAAWCDELGCGAVDKGANQPNIFVDPKSSESGQPYFSNGAPDALMQRQFLRAALGYWENDANNPASDVYDGRMLLRTTLWTWDARPYPAFPALYEVWRDGANHPAGHWLTGRIGGMASDEIVAAIARDFDVELAAVEARPPFVVGYVIDGPQAARAALDPVLSASGLDVHDAPEGLTVARASGRDPMAIDDVVAEDGPMLSRRRPDPGEAVGEVALAYVDRERAYQSGAVTAIAATGGMLEAVSAGLVLDAGSARATAERLLVARLGQGDTVELTAPPSLAALEAGDAVSLDGSVFEIAEIRDGLALRISARVIPPSVAVASIGGAGGPPASGPPALSVPVLDFAQLPPAPDAVPTSRLVAGAFASPWPGRVSVTSELTGSVVVALDAAAALGELAAPMPDGDIFTWDDVSMIEVTLYTGHLSSRDDDEVLAGANRLAVETDAGGWEVIAFAAAELVAPQTYRLTRLLRGQGGTDYAIGPGGAGNRVMVLDARVATLPVPADWLGADVELRSYAGGSDATGTLSGVTVGLDPILPLAPVHLEAVRQASGDIALSWIRRSRADTDSWVPADAPLDFGPEAYCVTILDGTTAVRTFEPATTIATYAAADQTADFGAPPASFDFTVAQLSALYGAGHAAKSSFID